MRRIETNIDNLACPWCGETYEALWSDIQSGGHRVTCADCSKEFSYHVTLEIDSIRKIEPESEEGTK